MEKKIPSFSAPTDFLLSHPDFSSIPLSSTARRSDVHESLFRAVPTHTSSSSLFPCDVIAGSEEEERGPREKTKIANAPFGMAKKRGLKMAN